MRFCLPEHRSVPGNSSQVWRYRLGVRIHGSQPWDRGSIPRTATNFTLAQMAVYLTRPSWMPLRSFRRAFSRYSSSVTHLAGSDSARTLGMCPVWM